MQGLLKVTKAMRWLQTSLLLQISTITEQCFCSPWIEFISCCSQALRTQLSVAAVDACQAIKFFVEQMLSSLPLFHIRVISSIIIIFQFLFEELIKFNI